MSATWRELCDLIIRPERHIYEADEQLGARRFVLGTATYVRHDLSVVNARGQRLSCSHFEPESSERRRAALPVVVYCHGNCGSRVDALECLDMVLPLGATVFAFDFAGSGMSDGDFVSLGWHEKDDLAAVVAHLRATGTVSRIALWGRSMGAATSILYASADPSIAGIVLDSPFMSLRHVIYDFVNNVKSWIPRRVTDVAIAGLRRSVRKRAAFDVNHVNPLEHVPSCFVPALFGHGVDDDFIRIHHTESLHEAYGGDANLIRFEGDHNADRPAFFFDSASIFLHTVLELDSLDIEPVVAEWPGAVANVDLAPSAVHVRPERLSFGDEADEEDEDEVDDERPAGSVPDAPVVPPARPEESFVADHDLILDESSIQLSFGGDETTLNVSSALNDSSFLNKPIAALVGEDEKENVPVAQDLDDGAPVHNDSDVSLQLDDTFATSLDLSCADEDPN